MAHGNGGYEMEQLIHDVFMKYFRNDINAWMEDAAYLSVGGKIAFTTDSFVVQPLFFPGGDIGRLSVCGTVNDLLTTGSTPLYLSAGFILEEGLSLETLARVCASMAETAREAEVQIVTGDTKVIEGNGGLYINTAGVGSLDAPPYSFQNAALGDSILVTGTLGDHQTCIMGVRLGLKSSVQSDAAPLGEMIAALREARVPVHGVRDLTRGGLGSVLNEIASASKLAPAVRETDIPIRDAVKAFCSLAGLDPLYMANEGKAVILVPKTYEERALRLIRGAKYGAQAAAIGSLEEGERPVLITRIGGRRRLAKLIGESLPRIC
jgi:hydrogenase expression/formation protein HypE